jgi:Amt family ammonium transporter
MEHIKVRDTLDVFACHGMAGAWGAVATGIFASKAINAAGADGLIHGNPQLVVAQIAAISATAVFTFITTYIIAKVVDKLLLFTVSEEHQQRGLDAWHYGIDPKQGNGELDAIGTS